MDLATAQEKIIPIHLMVMYQLMRIKIYITIEILIIFKICRISLQCIIKSLFRKDNKLSFEAVITKQKEIQENLYLDTQL